MAHDETVMEIMNQLIIADKHIVGDLMAHKGLWTAGVSAVNNSYKALNLLVDAGRLERGNSYFRLPGCCKSEYKEHAQHLTKALASIIKLNYTTTIFREHEIKEVGLRPDAIVLLIRGNEALCFILEVMNNESPAYFTQKRNVWDSWQGAKDYLSKLFNTNIKAYDIVPNLDHYIMEVTQ
jgi:hypothetical protein